MEILKTLVVSTVWAGHPVGFDFLTYKGMQFVAYYDADRKMTVASRKLGDTEWTYGQPEGIWLEARGRLSSTIAWDSHNSVTMAIDDNDQIHLCGNMHVDPLIYFRTTKPLDVTSFERVDRMVGEEEDRCTYPRFMRGNGGELIFRYRDGKSGNGVDYYNVYDPKSESWRRLVDEPLLDGMDQMNAYARMPEKGPDGRFHMVWMWRDTPDCATNHDISYARSEDLVHWEAGDGTPLELPITVKDTASIVDPSPPGQGLINMVQSLGYDGEKRPVLSYTRYDEAGNTQAYCARLEDGAWKIYQVSDWNYRWDFSGGGSVPAEVRLGGIGVRNDGLALSWWHQEYGRGVWQLDPETLAIVGEYDPPEDPLPEDAMKVESDYPGMSVRTIGTRGKPAGDTDYVLRWETLGPNRDRPRDEAPPPSELRMYEVRE